MHNSHPADAQLHIMHCELCTSHYALCIMNYALSYFLCFSSAIGIAAAASFCS